MAKRRVSTMGMAMPVIVLILMMVSAYGSDTNPVFDPCKDTTTQKGDGFTFGVAFSTKDSFFSNEIQLSPCDRRLLLSDGKAQLAVFRPKVDEISLLTINNTFDPRMAGGYMVAFAGSKFAARSPPVFVADNTNIVTSFTLSDLCSYSLPYAPTMNQNMLWPPLKTYDSSQAGGATEVNLAIDLGKHLVLDFKKGTLENLYWKKFGCSSCKGKSICLNNQDCGLPVSQCKRNGGPAECNLGIQIAFSGTDKSDNVLNSWYEVANLRQYSLFALYSDFRDSITRPFDNLL